MKVVKQNNLSAINLPHQNTHTHLPGMPVEYDNYESVEVQPEEVPSVYYNNVILHKMCTVRTPLDNTVSSKYTIRI